MAKKSSTNKSKEKKDSPPRASAASGVRPWQPGRPDVVMAAPGLHAAAIDALAAA